MIAPAIAVWAAAQWSTSWVLFATEMLGVLGGVLHLGGRPTAARRGRGAGGRAGAGAGAHLVPAAVPRGVPRRDGVDPGAVRVGHRHRRHDARARRGGADRHRARAVGPGLAGGRPALRRDGPLDLAVLAARRPRRSPPCRWRWPARSWGLAAFGFLAGLLCAPTITASVDQASRLVPAAVRGEAMGWHGSFLTTGGALGAPIAGVAIDRGGAAGRVRRRGRGGPGGGRGRWSPRRARAAGRARERRQPSPR